MGLAPSSPLAWHTHHVEVLLVVAPKQEEEVGTGPVQQRVAAQLREEPPQLHYPQGRVRSAEQQLRGQRVTCISCPSLPAAQGLCQQPGSQGNIQESSLLPHRDVHSSVQGLMLTEHTPEK